MKFAKITMLLSVAVFMACKYNRQKTEPPNENAHMHHQAIPGSGYPDSVNSGLIAQDTLKKSVPRVAMKTIGTTHIHINYSSPGVRGRIIWGGLVPYNAVWATGAHSATKIILNNAVLIDNKKVAAGTYAIFTIPGEKEWVFILNKNHEQHLADDYAETEDVLRYRVEPQQNAMTQRLTYGINKLSDTSGTIEILWEKLKLVVPFKTAS